MRDHLYRQEVGDIVVMDKDEDCDGFGLVT